MKKLFTTLAIIPLLVMIGCSNNQDQTKNESEGDSTTKQVTKHKKAEVKAEKEIPDLANYETITLEEKDEQREITIKYPQFNYEPVDKLIKEEMESQFASQKGLAGDLMNSDYEDGMENNFHFAYMEFSEPVVTDEFISIHFTGNVSMGAPTSNPIDYSFNYDLKQDKIIKLEDVLKSHQTNLLAISKQITNKLITDDEFSKYRSNPVTDDYKYRAANEARPTIEKYNSFTLEESGITFHQTYYDIFPHAAGIVSVTANWDKVSVNEQETEADDQVYTNDDYHFSLHIPKSWHGNYRITEGNWNPVALASIDFQLTNEGEEISNIFSINIYDKDTEMISEMETIIVKGEKYLFTYNKVGEPSPDIYEGGKFHHLEQKYTQMVNEDVDELVQTFILK